MPPPAILQPSRPLGWTFAGPSRVCISRRAWSDTTATQSWWCLPWAGSGGCPKAGHVCVERVALEGHLSSSGFCLREWTSDPPGGLGRSLPTLVYWPSACSPLACLTDFLRAPPSTFTNTPKAWLRPFFSGPPVAPLSSVHHPVAGEAESNDGEALGWRGPGQLCGPGDPRCPRFPHLYGSVSLRRPISWRYFGLLGFIFPL